MTLPQAFEVAVAHHQAGRLAEAEAIYRQILVVDPRHADALHYLGIMAHQVGRNDVAEEMILKAIASAPANPEFHGNLGVALAELGRHEEAIAEYRRALQLRPDDAKVHSNLGNALREQGRLAEAVDAFRRAIELSPDFPPAHNNLGNALKDQGQLGNAVAAYRRAVQLQPDYAIALSNLGSALREQGCPGEAVESCLGAIHLRADFAEAHYNLGNALMDLGHFEKASDAYCQALRFKPEYTEAHNNLGNALRELGRLDEAVASYHRAIRRDPMLAEAHNNLGVALRDRGQFTEGIAAFRRALQLRPDLAEAHSNLLMDLHYLPDFDPDEVFREHLRFEELNAEPLAGFIKPHGNDRNPERRLRIGYVSPDFREHPVAFFLEGLLAAHDRSQVEVFCYADQLREDAFTARFRQYAGQWRVIAGLKDDQVAELIREDGIDILVDLAGHTADNRLLVFARKPAPVQVTWLGYWQTTGMKAMDYRVTDAFADPPGATEHLHTEELVRLPDVFACFRPAEGAPPVNALPAKRRGSVTFGSFHTLAKLNDPLLESWARILHGVPDSRLLMAAAGLNEDSQQGRLRGFFAGRGIDAGRLEFKGRQPLEDYLALHHGVDVLLDSHPFSGHTVSCHALWMGVPVVTLAGRTHCSRMVGSVLGSVGLREWIARSPEEYVKIACEIAWDLSRLAQLRATLRGRMEASPLTDAPRFARNMEVAYRQMWRAWCAQ